MKSIKVNQTGIEVAGELYVGTDQSPIQRALAYLKVHGGGSLFIEKGTYDINQSILVDFSNVEISGEGNHTFLKSSIPVATDVGAIDVKGTITTKIENIYIHNLKIGSNVAQASGNLDAIRVEHCGEVFAKGSLDVNKDGIVIEDCIVQYSARYGINLSSSANNTITGNTVQNNNSYGISLISSANNTITDNTVQNNSNNGIYLNSASNNNVVMSNILQTNTSGNLLNTGTGTLLYGNKELA